MMELLVVVLLVLAAAQLVVVVRLFLVLRRNSRTLASLEWYANELGRLLEERDRLEAELELAREAEAYRQ